MSMQLKEKVLNLPASPGVYLMKDRTGTIIYVGKAKNLKRRVQSYFYQSKSHSIKVMKLVQHIDDFDYILTDTEFEAFLLECKLIKEIKPYFNKKMKSPQSYTYISIQMDEPYPSITIVDNPVQNRHSLCFGPYGNRHYVEKAIIRLKEFFKILCNNPGKRNSPCLNYSLGLCIGICRDNSTMELYRNIINKIIGFLQGTDRTILQEMEQKMLEASNHFDFETATKYRDTIALLTTLLKKEKVIEFTKNNHNIAVVEQIDCTVSKYFLIKGNKVIFSEKTTQDQLVEKIQSAIFTHFKKNAASSLEVTKEELDEAEIIYRYLTGSKCKYIIIQDEWLEPKNHVRLHEEMICLLSSS
jgi:excinuclease ABC subunit C